MCEPVRTTVAIEEPRNPSDTTIVPSGELSTCSSRHTFVHPKYSYGGARHSISAAQFDTVLAIAIALPPSFVRQGSLSLAECTNTKTHKSLFHNSLLSSHIRVLGYPCQTGIYFAR